MQKLGIALLAFLVASAIYLYAWPAPNLVYPAVVLAHAGFGVLFALLGLRYVPKLRSSGALAGAGGALMAIGAILGIVLIFIGTSRPQRYALWAHIAACALAVVLLGAWRVERRTCAGAANATPWGALAGLGALVAVVALGGWYARTSWSKQYVIKNPNAAPLTMDDEGDGSSGMFFPSSAQVAGKRKIPAKFFMESDACARCHQDIYNQWQKSAHHFSSFNNQWYRKSIEYMQDVRGTKPSKWCGGCHDPAVLYSGLMDTPIKQIIHRPESQAGLGCMMCHSIVKVKSTMGQADFMLEYPELHELAATKNPVMRALHDFTIKLNPEPHRRVFLKPFMKDQTAEFCSSCHKVHLDVPVNNYRWIRGFNEYDNWQASGVSGFGARSFYYPPKSQQCADCHMPAAKSNDFGNIDGFVHSHQFPGANTALPTANQDPEQLKLIENFLKTALTVDIFAISHAAATPVGGSAQAENATTFAVGEEGEVKTAGENTTEAVPVTAPLDETNPVLRRGDSVRMDVVVRTRKVGHFFPGGTVDAFDTWLELKAVDDKGQPIFWSGKVEDDGKGPVEKGAHFYRSLQIDEHGNPINKRNAWSTRSTVYVRLIPPGAADTVHFRVNVPENAGDNVKFTARLCYRKFSWFNTHFAYAGQSKDGVAEPLTKASYDDRNFTFDGDTSGASGKLKRVPDLPVEVLAEKTIELRVMAKNTPLEAPKTMAKKDEWQRWNDYGIGLFLQGDLNAAAAAFQKVTEADPNNPDGWVNLGRVAVQEGDMERGREVLTKALKISPSLARAHFFYARVLRSDGNYDGAAQELQAVLAQYPKDRVVRNDLGRVYFLQRRYQEAIAALQQVMEVDPEDLQANYNLMLCYRGLGKTDVAADYEKRYLRFKADESSQALTGEYRRKHPEDNNERQLIHEHLSVPLVPASKNVSPTKTAKTTQNGASAGK